MFCYLPILRTQLQYFIPVGRNNISNVERNFIMVGAKIVNRTVMFTWSWLNSLWPRDTIWRHRSGSTLVQVMAWCLTAPSHYLNQYWLITSKVQWHSSHGNFTRYTSPINHWLQFENHLCKLSFKSPRGQWVYPWIHVFTSSWLHFTQVFLKRSNITWESTQSNWKLLLM